MARPLLYTDDQVKDALEQANGQVYVAARILKCSYQVFYSRFRQHPELREFAQGFKEVITDQVEQVLIQKALVDKDNWAVGFWLKTQAKHRGYTERQEFSGVDGKPIEITTIEVIKPSEQ
jgi:hypothetical protein